MELLRQVLLPAPHSSISTLAHILQASVCSQSPHKTWTTRRCESAFLLIDAVLNRGIVQDAEELRMMSSYYHPAKEADMAAMTEPLCLERGNEQTGALHLLALATSMVAHVQ